MEGISSTKRQAAHRSSAGWLLAAMVCLCATSSFAQLRAGITWDPPIRITHDSSTSILPQCLVNGDTVHLVWFGIDERLLQSGDGVQYSRSTDGGETFSEPTRLLPFEISLTGPQSAHSGGSVYIAVAAVIDTSYGTFLLRSADGGGHWDAPRLLRSAVFPLLIAATDSLVFVHTINPISRAHSMLRSTNFGATWVLADSIMPELSGMVVRDGIIHAVGPAASRIDDEVGYYFSPNLGGFWAGPDILSIEDVTKSQRATIAANERGDLFVAWSDTGTVIIRSSTDGGASWRPQTVISGEVGTVSMHVAAGQEFACVAWDTDIDNMGMIALRTSDDFGETYFLREEPVEAMDAAEPFVDISGNELHMTWHQHEDGVCEVYYRHATMEVVIRPPTAYHLQQNFPNPFSNQTVVGYHLPQPSHVFLAVYNLLGQRVAVLVDAEQPEGRYSVPMDGSGLPSGIYFYRLLTERSTETKKLTVIR